MNTQTELPSILDIRVDWMEGWANDPRWTALLSKDDYPKGEEPIWHIVKHLGGSGRTTCRAEKGVVVRYFTHDPRDQAGYGGSVYTATDRNGVTYSFKGPWSSRSAVINSIFLGLDPCVEVAYTDSLKDWNSGYAMTAGDLKVSAILTWLRNHNFVCGQKIIDENGPKNRYGRREQTKIVQGKIQACWMKNHGEKYFRPLREDGRPKNEDGEILEVFHA